MAKQLVQGWNDDPPPTAGFLERLALWLSALDGDDTGCRLRAYDAMIEAIASPQDLAQFLLEVSGHLRSESIENRTVDRYWDALAGVLVVDGDKAAQWSGLARILDKALYYE
jgi:hypothetical protein